jgi:hypothetical protein
MRESDKLLTAIRHAKESAVRPKNEPPSDDDLPELDQTESSSVSTEVGNIGDEEPKPSSSAIPYKEAVITVPFGRDLLDIPAGELSRFSLEVVEAEEPIHTHEVARRIREAFRLQKTGKRILAHVKSSLQLLARKGTVIEEGEFWSTVGQSIAVARSRRNAALPLRRATMIAPAEYQVALLTIIAEAVAISGDDLIVETARLFGFDRTGADLKDAIDRQVETKRAEYISTRTACDWPSGVHLSSKSSRFSESCVNVGRHRAGAGSIMQRQHWPFGLRQTRRGSFGRST